MAETIANNVRSRIIQEHLNNPAYYDRMSKLLEEIIADLKAKRLDYAAYLQKVADLARRVLTGLDDATPDMLKSRPWLRALYDNLKLAGAPAAGDAMHEPAAPAKAAYAAPEDPKLALALAIDEAVRRVRPDDWRGSQARENQIKRALWPLLGQDVDEVERVFLVIKAQKDY